MPKLNEQGTIADIPLRSTSRLYYVRVENNQPVDEGWVSVDEAKRMNSTDRRMHGQSMNRYFQDAETGKSFSQSMGTAGPVEAPPMGGPEGAPEGGIPEEPMGPEGGMGAEDEMGLGAPAGPDDMGAGAEGAAMGGDDLGLGGNDDMSFSDEFGGEDDELGLDDLGDDDLGLEDEQPMEIIVPRRIKLVPESLTSFEDIVDEACKIPPQFLSKLDNKDAKEKRAKEKDDKPIGRATATKYGWKDPKTKKKEDAGPETTEAGTIEALLNGDITAEEAINEQTMGTAGQVGYNRNDQGVLGRQVTANTQMKAPQMPWGQQQQQQQQPGAQIPQDLQPLYQQYMQAMQSGDEATAAQLKNQLAFNLQTQGIDPTQVLQ